MKKFLVIPFILSLSLLLGSAPPSKVTHIALFGFNQSSLESVMIFSYNSTHRGVFLTALATGAQLNSQDTLKQSYNQGGLASSLQTLNENLKIDIDKYIAIDLKAIEVLVNQIDGIELKIKANELDYIPDLNSAGPQVLNGPQAIAYTKIKLNYSDYFGQLRRQQKAVAVLGKKLKTYPKFKLLTLIYDFSPHFETNLNINEMISLATQLVFGNNEKLVQLQLPDPDFNDSLLPKTTNENFNQWRDIIY